MESSDGDPKPLKDDSHTFRTKASQFVAIVTFVDVLSVKYEMRLKKEMSKRHIIQL